MSYCPKCGRQILDESLGCPVCSVREDTTTQETPTTEPQAEKINEFTVEDGNGTAQRFESAPKEEARSWNSYQEAEPKPVPEQDIPMVLKVIIIVAIILTNGIGAVAGLVAGIVLLKSPIENYRKFGKTLTIVSGIFLGISLVCCLVYGTIGIFGNLAYY